MKKLLSLLLALFLAFAWADVNEVYYRLVNDDPFPSDVPWKSLDTADIDGDGLIDVVLGRTDGLVQIWEQTAPGATTFQVVVDSFVTTPIYRVPVFVSICYFDADSLLDIITHRHVLHGPDSFSHHEQIEPDSYSFQFIHHGFFTTEGEGIDYIGAFYDVDNDGLMDYLGGGIYGVYHLEQTPEDIYTFAYLNSVFNISYTELYVQTIGVGDVDGDNLLDLVINRFDEPDWLELNAEQTAIDWNLEMHFDSLYIYDAYQMNFELLDYDSDGGGDLFIMHDDEVALYENQFLQDVEEDEIEPVVSLCVAPNPVTTSCRLAYSLPQSRVASLAIYNIKGQQVRTFENLPGNEGEITWDMRAQDGRPVAAGVYFCRLSAGGRAVTRKMLLLK